MRARFTVFPSVSISWWFVNLVYAAPNGSLKQQGYGLTLDFPLNTTTVSNSCHLKNMCVAHSELFMCHLLHGGSVSLSICSMALLQMEGEESKTFSPSPKGTWRSAALVTASETWTSSHTCTQTCQRTTCLGSTIQVKVEDGQSLSQIIYAPLFSHSQLTHGNQLWTLGMFYSGL